jgi:hypothetical protein
MNYIKYLFFLVTMTSFSQELTLEQANRLASLPLKCLQQEYPNKLNQLLLDSTEIQSPKKLHPAFYGCFDWHSSVHGHWSLVYLLKNFPKLENREEIIKKLTVNLSQENIQEEINYLSKNHEKTFERTYGWSWVLKLQMELDDYNEPFAKELANNLKPLSTLITERYIEFLPKLVYPVRIGMHTNTAFGLSNAWDYAVVSNNQALETSIKDNALRLFKKDKEAPLSWEPNGYDFLSPTMEEIGLMQRILPKTEFLKWFKSFAKPFFDEKFTWEVATVSDRTDGLLVHLDGLNFSRAWNLYHLMNQYPKEFSHLKKIADAHLAAALPSVVDGNYEGEHWLATFCLRAFEEKK